MSPTNQNIICALYGSGNGDQTAYTDYRSGYTQASCLDQGITVLPVAPGTSNIPLNAGPNTIYVLSSGTYIQTGSILINKCTAIVGTTGTSILYTSTGLDDTYYGNMIGSYQANSGKQYTILDNISLDGTGDGV